MPERLRQSWLALKVLKDDTSQGGIIQESQGIGFCLRVRPQAVGGRQQCDFALLRFQSLEKESWCSLTFLLLSVFCNVGKPLWPSIGFSAPHISHP